MSTSEHDEERLLLGLTLDDRGGPARRISRDQAAALVDQALDQALGSWAGEPLAPLLGASAARAPRRNTRVFSAVAMAAVVLLAVVGGASAARWYFGKREAPAAPLETRLKAPAKRATSIASATTTGRTVLPELTLEADLDEPEANAAVPRAARHEKAEPEDLLQRANQLRAAGRFQSAADTYAQVYERYPRSLSAYAAQIAAASIELEHLGKPQHARKLFESALHGQPKGALDLEARQGLALSLRDLGRDQDEASALRALIRAHGETPAARRAEARLKELTGDLP
jgi:tetratricopeptide (TPR) repeat protein